MRFKISHMIRIAVVIVMLASLFDLKAQQTPLYGQYFLNPYLYNPATAGIDGVSKAYFLYRKQWIGVDGAPETQAFTIDGQLEKQPIGLGLSFFNDVNNVIGRASGSLTGAYTVDLTEAQSLSFGMSAMIIQNKIYFDRLEVEDDGDPNILSKVDQRSVFEMNAGLNYRFKRLNIGFAADQLFQNEVTYENSSDFQSVDFNYIRHYITTIQYDFDLGKNFGLNPLLLMRTVQGLPSQFDLNLLFDYQDKIWTAIAYRHQIGMGFSMGWTLEDRFVFGYTYEVPTTDLSVIGSSSHEFVVGLRFGKKKDRDHMRKTTEEPPSYEQLRSENAAQYEEIDELKQRNEEVIRQLQESQRKLDEQNEELQRLKEVMGSYEADLNRTIERLGVDLDSVDSSQEGKFFLVVGAFRELDDAKSHQKLLRRETGLDTWIIQNHLKTWFFIYSEELHSLNGAQGKIDALSNSKIKEYIIGNPWVYEKE